MTKMPKFNRTVRQVENWRHNKRLFMIQFKHEINKWFSDFVVTDIAVFDEFDDILNTGYDEWVIKIHAFRAGDTNSFCIPELHISKEVLHDSRPMTLWALIHRMIEQGYEYLCSQTPSILAVRE